MNKNRTTIRITEEELNTLIKESVEQMILENPEDEGFWNQLKQGVKSFVGNGYGKGKESNFRNTTDDRQARGEHTANWLNKTTPMNLKGRWNAAKTGFKKQGVVDNMDEFTEHIDAITQTIQNGNSKNKPQLLQACEMLKKYGLMIKNSANGQISKANNDIYRGMATGTMGSGRLSRV